MQNLQNYNRSRRIRIELENKIHDANLVLMCPFLDEGTRDAMEQSVIEFHEELKDLECPID